MAFTPEGERLIGDGAKNQLTTNPENTVFDAKRLIGRTWDDKSVQHDLTYFPFKVIEKNKKPHVQVNVKGEKKTFAAEEISAMVLVKMKVTSFRWVPKCLIIILGRGKGTIQSAAKGFFKSFYFQVACRCYFNCFKIAEQVLLRLILNTNFKVFNAFIGSICDSSKGKSLERVDSLFRSLKMDHHCQQFHKHDCSTNLFIVHLLTDCSCHEHCCLPKLKSVNRTNLKVNKSLFCFLS